MIRPIIDTYDAGTYVAPGCVSLNHCNMRLRTGIYGAWLSNSLGLLTLDYELIDVKTQKTLYRHESNSTSMTIRAINQKMPSVNFFFCDESEYIELYLRFFNKQKIPLFLSDHLKRLARALMRNENE